MTLTVRNLGIKNQSGQLLFDPLSFNIAGGSFATIMGPSGIGKSTLINAIGGFLDASFLVHGEINLDGQNLTSLPAEDRAVGVLFQSAHLFPHLNIGQNLSFGLNQKKLSADDRNVTIEGALESVGLSGYYKRDPATLSGGQKARVALMRCILSEPKAILLDEPFGSLDEHTKIDMRQLVIDYVERARIPALLVTHDSEEQIGALIKLKVSS